METFNYGNFEKHLKELERLDKENAAINGHDFFLWNTPLMAAQILSCAKEENGDDESYFADKAYWLSLRLKFTDPQIIALAWEFYKAGIKHYDLKINGHYIFEIMANYNYTYPEALLQVFLLGLDKSAKMEFPPIFNRPSRIGNALLRSDGTIAYDMPPYVLEFMTEEDIKKFYVEIFEAIKKVKVPKRYTDEENQAFLEKLRERATAFYGKTNSQ